MPELLQFAMAPFVMCLILVGIHCYLGLHVLARGVVFVDLALAQVAALGSTVAFLLGYDHHAGKAYGISLLATIIAALFFSISNQVKHRISQEAMIGITYAFASSALILIVDRMSHGAEHIKYALVGQILWVTWGDVGKVALIYGLVSVIHYAFRKRMIESSFGRNGHWIWDFLFYALFGVVITSSVHVAGVLLVFAFLIVPAVMSSLFFDKIFHRLLFGWGLGFILASLGLFFSFWKDFPAGSIVVVLFTAVPMASVIGMAMFQKRKR